MRQQHYIDTDPTLIFIKHCSCGQVMTMANVAWLGLQETNERRDYNLRLYNCPKCNSTHGMREKKDWQDV